MDALKGHRHLRGLYVFCQEDGQPLTDGLMKLPLQRALRRAGISREQGLIGWHDLRHTYGSHLATRESAAQQLDQPEPVRLTPPQPRHLVPLPRPS